jgi:hypothetical protein
MKFVRRLRVLCVCLCALCGLKAASLDREAFTFTDYDLQLRVEPDQQRLGVRGTITARNDSKTAQKNVTLQISSTLSWRSIFLEGKPVQFVAQPYNSDIDHTGSLSEAIVTVQKEIQPGNSLTLAIAYEGIIPLDATRLIRIGVPEDEARHSEWDQIGNSFTAVRGVGHVIWYPVSMEAANLSEGNELFEAIGRWNQREAESSFKMDIAMSPLESDARAPLLLCGGEGASAAARGSSAPEFRAMHCLHSRLGSLTPFFAAANYDVLNRDSITIFHLPDHNPGAQSYALATDLAVPFVKDWFGVPAQKPRVIELADSGAAPFEDGVSLLTSLAREDTRLYQLSAVHQLTHAAFPSPRLWISEGAAHFGQAAYLNQQNGREAALQFLASHEAAVLAAEKANGADSGAASRESLVNTYREEFYRSKAMYVWWMLRDMIGDDRLKKALSSYRAESDREPSYVQKLISAHSDRDLEWFFDDWVYRDKGLPDFRVESANARTLLGAGYVVAVTVDNLGSAGAEVPVTVNFDGGSVSKRLEVRGKSKATIRMEIPYAAREVTINDGSVPESDTANNNFIFK